MRFMILFLGLLSFNQANAVTCVESFNSRLAAKFVETGRKESDSDYYAKLLNRKVGQEDLVASGQIFSLKEGYDQLEKLSENEMMLVTFQSDMNKAAEKNLHYLKKVAGNKTSQSLLKIGDFLSNYNPWALADRILGFSYSIDTNKDIANAKIHLEEVERTNTIEVNDYEVQRTLVIAKIKGELKVLSPGNYGKKWISARDYFSRSSQISPNLGIVSIRPLRP